MGTNGQAMLSASSSAEEAGEGGGMSGGFPFVVLSGGEATAAESVNPAFAAYAKRSIPPTRTAREALVLALAEVEEAARVAGDDVARVDEASYGVTRSPFASVSAPVAKAVATKAPVKADDSPPAAAPVSTAPTAIASAVAPAALKKESVSRRRPVLRTTAAAGTPASIPVAVPAPALGEAVPPPAADLPASPVVDSPAPPEAAVATEVAAGKLKITLRRDVSSATRPPVPAAVPPPDAPFFFGPVMDGSRSPLVPLPVASGVPGGSFVPPAHVMTRSPFPAAGGAAPAVAGESASASPKGKPPAGAVTRRDAAAARAGERHVGGRRAAVVGVSLAVLALVAYFGYQSPYWPFRLKQVVVAGEASSESGAASASAAASEPTAAATAPYASALVQAVAHPTRPAPGAGFVGMLEGLRITGVLQGEPVRAIIDGRLVQAGDLVDVAREIRLVGLDVGNRQLIFEDRTTARANVRY